MLWLSLCLGKDYLCLGVVLRLSSKDILILEQQELSCFNFCGNWLQVKETVIPVNSNYYTTKHPISQAPQGSVEG